MPPGMPPRRYRGRGNSAAVPPPPAGARRPRPRRSTPSRSPAARSRLEVADWSDFVGTTRIGSAEVLCNLERLVERLAFDYEESEQLFLGFGKWPVDHQGRF